MTLDVIQDLNSPNNNIPNTIENNDVEKNGTRDRQDEITTGQIAQDSNETQNEFKKSATASKPEVKAEIKEFKIPYLPPKVENCHIHDNGKLLRDDEIMKLKSLLEDEEGICHKKMSGCPYTIIVQDNNYYAVYYGKHNKALGSGAFGSVKLVQDLDSGEWYTIKVQRINDHIANEINILDKTGHLVKTSAANPIIIQRFSPSKFRRQAYFLMSLAKGQDLFEIVDSYRERSPLVWLETVIDMINALLDFHKQGYVHADVKLENFLEDYAHHCAHLVDVAFALKCKSGQFYSDTKRICGTPGYLAPELHAGTPPYSEKSDVFALGTAIGFLLELAYQENTSEGKGRLYTEAQVKLFQPDARIPDAAVRVEIRNFLAKMLFADSKLEHCGADRRPTLPEVLEFFTKIKKNLPAKLKKRNVGIVPVETYEENKDDENFIYELQTYDEIRFVETGTLKNQFYYAKLRNELVQHSIVVKDEALQVPCELYAEITSFMQKNYPSSEVSYHCLPLPISASLSLISLSETKEGQPSPAQLIDKIPRISTDKPVKTMTPIVTESGQKTPQAIARQEREPEAVKSYRLKAAGSLGVFAKNICRNDHDDYTRPICLVR